MAEVHPVPTDSRFQNLNGRVFGKLTVLFYAGKKSGKYSLWHCHCECGREHTVVSSLLTLGQAISCPTCGIGRRSGPRETTNPTAVDLTGRTFGRLTVVALDHRVKRPRPRSYWRCHCECGETTIARGDQLQAGTRVSCGCLIIVRRWRDVPKPNTNTCPSCGETKPFTLEFFYRHPSGKYGFLPRCKDCIRKEHRESWARNGVRIRMEVLIHYSGDPPHCQCPGCLETHLEFLSIDHIDGGGTKHRREIGPLYPWLIRKKFPPGFRVLCHNCNLSQGLYGYCPHER